MRGVACDLGSAAGCAALVNAVHGTDVLVNNVGIFGPQDFFAIPDEEWERFMAVNMSGVRLARAYLPGMIERGWAGCCSCRRSSALNIPADMIHYGVTPVPPISPSPSASPGPE